MKESHPHSQMKQWKESGEQRDIRDGSTSPTEDSQSVATTASARKPTVLNSLL